MCCFGTSATLQSSILAQQNGPCRWLLSSDGLGPPLLVVHVDAEGEGQ